MGSPNIDNVVYKVDAKKNVASVDQGKRATGDVVIAGEVSGAPVTRILCGAFYGNKAIVSVQVPEGVREISPIGISSKGAFQRCTSLRQVVLPDSLTWLGGASFQGCESLSNIVFGRRLQVIDDGAFESCKSLTGVELPLGLGTIGQSAFAYCTGLAQISIPGSVKSIGERAFAGCKGLTDVTIGSGVKIIGPAAFSGCSNLRQVTIPDSVTDIDLSSQNPGKSFSQNALASPIGQSMQLAFGGCDAQLAFCCSEASFAAKYARSHHIKVVPRA